MKKNSLVSTILIIVSCFTYASNTRIISSINQAWKFSKGEFQNASQLNFDDSKWENVTIPHTWNKDDALDEIPGFYRGTAWYRRTISVPVEYKDKKVFISFDGVNQETELLINGLSIGTHLGGYTRFVFDITDKLKFGEKNIFAVKVSNMYNENIPPLSADFTFFGGIYRDVNLIITDKNHISTTDSGSSGVYITTPKVNDNEATVEIKTLVKNENTFDQKLKVENIILSPKGETLLSKSVVLKLKAGESSTLLQKDIRIENPLLWSPDSPNLYKVITRISDTKTNQIYDEVMNPLGLRWYEFTTDKGFFLNGKSVKLIGTNRHQTYLNMGYALPDEIHVADIKLLKAMGANFLRVSHYPQDHILMEMCDKLGIICSVEIPIVNAITENEAFTNNCLIMAHEMVLQDFNRPSVLIWAYMNEVLLRPPFAKDSIRNAEYFKNVGSLAAKIENQIRKDDPARYTLIPSHGNLDAYIEAGLSEIPKIVGFNLYQGWYGGVFSGFEEYLENAKKKIPNKPFIITEYGADVDPRLHSFQPQRFDYTQEYANLYHEHYSKQIMSLPWISGANIWNLSDFYSEERGYAVPHVNSKGITGLNREKKDTYLQYQAMLLKKPVVVIGGENWKIRGGIADANGICVQPLKIYSNQSSVELFANGKSLGIQKVTDNIANFKVPFVDGENIFDAVSGDNSTIRDQLKIDFRAVPENLKTDNLSFKEINVMLGSKRYFEDKTNSVIWIPEKEYSKGSWGYIGGQPFTTRTRHGAQPASDLDIIGTGNDPVFQTARIGIESFKLDVSDGKYTVYLNWAELQTDKELKTLAYNLGNDVLKDDFYKRVFDVDINGVNVQKNLNLTEEYGAGTAIIKKFEVDVVKGEGINIQFRKVTGEPILNAIRVYKNY